MMAIRGGIGILLAAWMLAGLGGCGVGKKQLEANIKSNVKAKGWPVQSVECPKVPRKDGESFECTINFDDGAAGTVNAETHGDGVTWEIKGVVLLDDFADKIKANIKSKGKNAKSVTCGAKGRKVMMAKNGETVVCEANVDGQKVTVEATFKNENGDADLIYR
jgi:hypothetical protein